MENQEKEIFYPGKKRSYLIFTLASTALLLGIFLASFGAKEGWGIITISFLGLISIVKENIKGGSFLELNKKGINKHFEKKDHLIKWTDIDKFMPEKKKKKKMVSYYFTSNYIKQNKNTKKNIFKIGEKKGFLIENFGKSPEELAEIMNQWKNKFNK